MTLATGSSSLNDTTTSRQLLGVLGALAAMILALGIAVQLAPSIGAGSGAGGGALSNDDLDWYRGWQQAPSHAFPPFVPPGR